MNHFLPKASRMMMAMSPQSRCAPDVHPERPLLPICTCEGTCPSIGGTSFSRTLFTGLLGLLLTLCSQVSFAADTRELDSATEREQVKYFEQHVRPLLVKHCYDCHGTEKQKGDLRVDSLGSLLAGGESGPALVPHAPADSLLMEAVRYESYEMPPSGKLSDEQIDILEKWIEMGAPWPGQSAVAKAKTSGDKITDEDRAFWSFQPLANPVLPEVSQPDWCRNEIDHFILQKLDESQLTPAPEASPETLVRRLYFDVIGLPPTPEQIGEFLADSSPAAYEKLVDQLLASPHYGENWARFWLDLVRYAESDGFRKDDYRPDAWRYRDYVIKSFNADKPFDQFTREQIAGDELAPHDPEVLVATGFLRHGIYEYNQRDARTQWQDMLNDITDTVGDTFMGMGMGCARCHDHKFDPILQKDYYRLQAFFANLSMPYEVALATPDERAAYDQQLQIWEEATAEIRAKLAEMEDPKLKSLEVKSVKAFPEETQEIYYKPEAEKTSYEKQISHLVYLQVLDRQQTLANTFKGDEKKTWETLKEELAAFDHLKPKSLPNGMTVADYGVQAPPVFIPSKERLGEVQPGFLTIFDPEIARIEQPGIELETTGRRSTLAAWLTEDRHPLTTRVIVNRIWKEHFGSGIVDSPSDFGHLGELPSHPELLDWLATQFVKNGWSLKWLHRQILLSATYRQSSQRPDTQQAMLLDPTNRLYWRANVRRLTAEQIRDAQLAAAGKLDTKSGGPGETAATSKRRSIYTKVMRNSRDPLLAAFDLPDRMTSAPSRNVTTSPSQSLMLINGDWTLARATEFAKRLQSSGTASLESQLRELFLTTLGRAPTERELALLLQYLEQSIAAQEAAAEHPLPLVRNQVLEVSDGEAARPPQVAQIDNLPENQFTVRATVLLRSLYPDSTVRSIVTRWDSNNAHPGWAIGVTSTKSAYKPGNLILQLVGKDAAGQRTYEVVPSNLHLELNRPYEVTVSVDLTQPNGVLFVARDLTNNEVRTAAVAHKVVAAESHTTPLTIGGRATQQRHRWDGWLDQIEILNVPLTEEQILAADFAPEPQMFAAQWSFDDESSPLADAIVGYQLELSAASQNQPASAFLDLCHVLLNSNEFIYID